MPNRDNVYDKVSFPDTIIDQIRCDRHSPDRVDWSSLSDIYPVAVWELLQTIDRIDQLADEGHRILLRIGGDMPMNLIEIKRCARRDNQTITIGHYVLFHAVPSSELLTHLLPRLSFTAIGLGEAGFDGCGRIGI